MIKITYEECEYFWNNRFRRLGDGAFASKQAMLFHIGMKCGIAVARHPEIREHATKYLAERKMKLK